MTPASAESRARQQRELDQEQMLVDLDQSIAEREQVRADRDQQRLDEAQVALDADSPAAVDHDLAGVASVNPRQSELGLAQDRSDAHQTQLDDNQRAQDLRRNVLDEQQEPLDHPANANRIITEAPPAAAEKRDRALHRRAVAAVARAEQAHQRADEALQRVAAYELRRGRRLLEEHSQPVAVKQAAVGEDEPLGGTDVDCHAGGRIRTAGDRALAGNSTSRGPVSAPAMTSSRSASQIRSTQPSGTTRWR